MPNQKAFIFSSEGIPAQYGIGKYIDILKLEASKTIERDFVFVYRSDKYDSMQYQQDGNIITIEIPHAKKGRKLTRLSAIGIIAVLDNAIGIDESDVFHFNESEHGSLVEVLKDFYGCKVIYTIHFSLWSFFYKNDYSGFLKDWESKKEGIVNSEISTILAEQSMCKISDIIISLNAGTHRFLEEVYGIDAQKIRQIENGVNIYPKQMSQEETALFRYNLGLGQDDKVILYVGRVDEEKGIKFLIQSYLAIDRIHNYKLIIVGHGDINGMLPLIYNKWRNIIFTGYVPATMVNNFYNIANFFVLPSLSEQGSYSVLEAISHKKPILVSDIPAFDYLVSGEMAIKVKLSQDGTKIENDVLQLELEKFIFNQSGYTEMTDKSYKLISDHFSSKIMFSILQTLYFSN